LRAGAPDVGSEWRSAALVAVTCKYLHQLPSALDNGRKVARTAKTKTTVPSRSQLHGRRLTEAEIAMRGEEGRQEQRLQGDQLKTARAHMWRSTLQVARATYSTLHRSWRESSRSWRESSITFIITWTGESTSRAGTPDQNASATRARCRPCAPCLLPPPRGPARIGARGARP